MASNPLSCSVCSIEVKPSTRTESELPPITYDPVYIVVQTDSSYIIDQYSITFVLLPCSVTVTTVIGESFDPVSNPPIFAGSFGGASQTFDLGTYTTDCCAHIENGATDALGFLCGSYDSNPEVCGT